MNNNVLITGGAGFIGSHLIEKLVQNPKNRVISLDNYFTGTEKNHIKGAEYTLELAQIIEAQRAYLKSGSPSCDRDGVTGEVLKRAGLKVFRVG